MEKKLIDYEGFEAYSKGVRKKYAEKKDIPTSLSNLQEDSAHQTVTDAEKTKWNKVADKVDKVDGKQLSTNDYTNEDKKKVDAIPDNPKYTDTIPDLSGYAKKENIPTKVSQLQNDIDFLTELNLETTYTNNYIKINDPKLSWYNIVFPKGWWVFNMNNNTNSPDGDSGTYFVFTTCNIESDDIFFDDAHITSQFVEQIAISVPSGKVYHRYSDPHTKKDSPFPEDELPEVAILDDGTSIPGVRYAWRDWHELTKDYATKEDVKKLMSNIPTLKKEVVTSLPTTGKDDVIYLVKDDKGKDNNNYLEYLWLNGKYELIGSTQVDLSGYATTESVSKLETAYNRDIKLVSGYIDQEAKNVRDMLKKKQDTIQWGNGIYKDPYGKICASQYNDASIQDELGKLMAYKLNKDDIQEFTQQELEEAFK